MNAVMNSSGSIKGGEFLDEMSDYQFHNKNSASHSYVNKNFLVLSSVFVASAHLTMFTGPGNGPITWQWVSVTEAVTHLRAAQWANAISLAHIYIY
jgi:hypothetical protein